MKVLVRADANKIIAMGHVMRCLSIADALSDKGVLVSFACASTDPKALIESRGYKVTVFNSDYQKMDEELPQMEELIKKEGIDLVIVDTYSAYEGYFEKLNEITKTAYVDDYGKNAFSVDYLINYNAYGEYIPYEEIYKKAAIKLPKLLLGPMYAPLRRDFQKKHESIKSDMFEVLLSTGGADATHVAITLLRRFNKEIEAGNLEKVRLNILVGPFNGDKEAIMDESVTFPGRVNLYSDITDMPGFLSRFDAAMSAAGSTTYELCSMGIPTMLFCTADNQAQIFEAFKKNGLMMTAGFTDKEMETVTDRLVDFMGIMSANADLCEEYSKKALQVTDALGAIRIADNIINIRA